MVENIGSSMTSHDKVNFVVQVLQKVKKKKKKLKTSSKCFSSVWNKRYP